VVDVTNYIMHAFGQPLHAFDAATIQGKVQVRLAKPNETLTTLDSVNRSLHPDDIVIADAQGPMCLAGVLGGLTSSVTAQTTQLFIESAYFNPIHVRKTAKRHGLNTDASFRFERGIDPNLTEYALKRAASLLKEVAGGEITSDLIDVYPKKIEDFSVFLNFEKTYQIIGQPIPKETIKKILASLDIKVNSMSDAGLGLTIPSYRVDVQREIDVIEEILRVYGYNNIQFSKKVQASMARSPRTADHQLQQLTSAQLNALGFHEMMNNSLTQPEYIALSPQIKPEFQVRMLNPLSQELAALRQSMLFSALEVAAYNINRKSHSLRLFEFGKTYHKLPSGYDENKHLSLLMSGPRHDEHWAETPKSVGFFELKGVVEALLARMGISKWDIHPCALDTLSEGLTYKVQQNDLVHFGVVKKQLLKHFDIKQDLLYADINWGALIGMVNPKMKVTPLPKFPEVVRDLALVMPESVPFEQLHQVAFQTEKALLQSVSLFDVYQGDKLPAGHKSYALRFILQDANKTLTDAQIDKVMDKLIQQFDKQCEARLRSA